MAYSNWLIRGLQLKTFTANFMSYCQCANWLIAIQWVSDVTGLWCHLSSIIHRLL